MILIVGSVILAALCLWEMWLIARKRVLGWQLSVWTGLLNLAYDTYTHQYGWIVSSVVSMWIAWRAWRDWRKT